MNLAQEGDRFVFRLDLDAIEALLHDYLVTDGFAPLFAGLGTVDVAQDPDDVGDVEAVRIFAGYAGWGAGQLEDEIGRNGWLNVTADPAIIFDTPVEQRYQRALGLLGFDPRMLSQEAGHA